MASIEDLNAALAFARNLKPGQSQASISDQMIDMAPLVEAMGYYDLADYLRQTGGAWSR